MDPFDLHPEKLGGDGTGAPITPPEPVMDLYHYTCDHGHRQLGDGAAVLLSASQQSAEAARNWIAAYIWMTDMAVPDRAALGLSSLTLSCDRMAHRYRVTDQTTCVQWVRVRRHLPGPMVRGLESPGTKLMHWWVSVEPVPVVWDP